MAIESGHVKSDQVSEQERYELRVGLEGLVVVGVPPPDDSPFHREFNFCSHFGVCERFDMILDCVSRGERGSNITMVETVRKGEYKGLRNPVKPRGHSHQSSNHRP
jgi:hypothetical protein